jgi:anaerobic magnesium-protoporphyrin IX monomethyl ester cyclase
MKVRLIEPAPPGINVYTYARYPRLGLPMIGAALKCRGDDVLIYNPQMAPVDWDDVYSSDLVGISTITSTAPAAYEYADDLRSRGIPVAIGGSHVTFMADEALQHADYVARGEGGDTLMVELLQAFRGERTLDSIAGLSFTRDGAAVHNPLRERCADLDDLPVPDLTLIVGHERMTSTPIMTSWGCPFACNFCSVTTMFGRRYRYRSIESVVAELKQKRPERVFFYDDNFAANPRRLKALLRALIANDLVMPWTAQVRTDVVGDLELLDLMRRSGCDRLCIGLESVNQETLDEYAKSQSVDDIVNALATLRRFGLKTHGMFVLGADADGLHSIRDTVRFAVKHHIDSLMLNILTPGPGTEQYAEMEAQGRLYDKRWELYDGQHVVFTPQQMTPEQLQLETLKGYLRFYSLRRWLLHLVLLRRAGLRLQAMGYLYVRKWRSDKVNQAFIASLAKMRPPRLSAPRG